MRRRFNSPEPSTSDGEEPLTETTQPLPSLSTSLTTYFESLSHARSPPQPIVPEIEDINVPSDSEDSLPPLDTDGPAWSTPVTGTKEEKQIIRRNKAIKKQKSTIARQQEEAHELAARKLAEDVEEVLDLLNKKRLRFGEFLKFIFDPENPQGNIRWHQFFAYSGEATEILNWWISSKNSETARNEVKEWAVKYVGCLVRDEAKTITKSKIFQTRDKVIDHQFVQAFSFSTLNKKLKVSAPVGMHILERLTTSHHAQEKHTERRRERTKMVSTTVAWS